MVWRMPRSISKPPIPIFRDAIIPAVHPHLDACLAILEEATRGAGPECAVRKDPNQWSAAEVVEHLQRAYRGTAKGLERCLEKGAPMATGQTLRQKLFTFGLVSLGYFPPGRRAPKHVMPTGELSLGAVLDAARTDLARLDTQAAKAREQFGRVKVVDHPLLGALTVDQWLKFHLVHTRHHEKHIRARR
jgi:hypothetical protein